MHRHQNVGTVLRPRSRRLKGSLGVLVSIALATLLASVSVELAAANARPYWVFFTDRPRPDSLSAAELSDLVHALPEEVWARRAGTTTPLPELRDLPVHAPYVAGVAAFGRIRHETRWFHGVSVELTDEVLPSVRALPFVRVVRPVAVSRLQSLGPTRDADGLPLEANQPLPPFLAGGSSLYGPSRGQLEEIEVPALHALGYTGNRVRVMMLDTGFRKDHDAFTEADLRGEYDFVFEDGDTRNEPEDDPGQHNHGTGCWAVLGGYDPGHLVGPAYGASFYLSKTEDIRSETQAEEDNYVAALEWADAVGVRVTSASLTYTYFDDESGYDFDERDGDTAVITRAIDIAAARGILCANANGNYGPDPGSMGTPADADSMVAVGAVDSLNVLAGFSSRGPTFDGRIKPEVVARGVSTVWADAGDPSAYGSANGTSLSTPLVGGVVALLLEAHPEWGAMDVRAALLNTADRHGSPNNEYGHGRVRAAAALTSTPVLFPRPFDIVTPPDGATLTTLTPTFTWRRTVDGDGVDPPTYTLWIRDTSQPGNPPLAFTAGTDTTFALSSALVAATAYSWEVTASDAGNHRRTSRETRGFTTPVASDLPPPDLLAGRLALAVSPNPFTRETRFRIDAPSSDGGDFEWALYDLNGRRLLNGKGHGSGGRFEGRLDARDRSGDALRGGVYALEVTIGNRVFRETVIHLPSSRHGPGRP